LNQAFIHHFVMTPNSTFRRFTPLFRLLACVLWCHARPLWAADQASLISEAKAHLQNNRNLEGLAVAKDAVREVPTDYRGHYYVGVAYLALGKFDEAQVAAEESLRHASDESKPQVEKLVAVIKETRETEGQSDALEKEGDKAFENGLAAKAANLYRKAYLVAPTRGTPGLKAAVIYADRLDQLLDAAVLWNKIVEAGDEASAAQAKDKLIQNTKALDQLYKEKSGVSTLANWLPLLEAFPNRHDLRLSVAALYAQERNVEKTIEHLAKAVKVGASVSQVAEERAFSHLLMSDSKDGAFETFLNDAFGAKLVSRLKEQHRQEQARRADIERQKEIKRIQEQARARAESARVAEAMRQRQLQEQQERAAQAKRQAEEEFVRRARALEK
jgi:tetratricopeptide (TPR) repeat protein